MRITMATIADFASVAVLDKLNVLGVFDRIAAQKFPVRHAQMFFAARFQFGYEDGDKTHESEVRLEDEDGKVILRTEGTIAIPKIAPGDVHSNNLVICLQNLEFKAPGNYVFTVSCGQENTRIPFKIVQLP